MKRGDDSTRDSIDFVVTWVDGQDELWLEKKRKYQGAGGDARASRYRDWNLLRYWFRGVEQFAPWVNSVYFVTEGHKPSWLNTNHPKLKLVTHEEFIPEQYLPTFSCRPIEFNLHKLPGLSEQFVYFNDDMFILQPVKKGDFFRNGFPCDSAILDALTVTSMGRNGERLSVDEIYSSLITNTAVLNRNFNKRESLRLNWAKWYSPKYGIQLYRNLALFPWNEFTGLKSGHVAYSLLRQTYIDLWSSEHDALDTACKHKFRMNGDVSSRLLSYWQIAQGNFMPRSPNFGIQYSLTAEEEYKGTICRHVANQKSKVICINDEYIGDMYDGLRDRLRKAFESVFPISSAYET